MPLPVSQIKRRVFDLKLFQQAYWQWNIPISLLAVAFINFKSNKTTSSVSQSIKQNLQKHLAASPMVQYPAFLLEVHSSKKNNNNNKMCFVSSHQILFYGSKSGFNYNLFVNSRI